MRYLILLLLSFPAFAKDALLSWDASVDPDQFIIHHIVNGAEQPDVAIDGTLREYTVTNLESGVHTFSASAVKDGESSEKSNSDGVFILNIIFRAEVVN